MHKTINTKTATIIIIIVAIISVGLIWFGSRNIPANNNIPQIQPPVKKACPMDAKMCPDGTSVGRTLPNCEFASCPEIVGIENKLVITSQKPNDQISNPVTVSGKAVGIWLFEGSFPIEVHDANGKLLGTGTAKFVPQSPNDTWMTDQLVNFQGEIKFSQPTTDTGYILFEKDNPSGLPQNDESFQLPVKF